VAKCPGATAIVTSNGGVHELKMNLVMSVVVGHLGMQIASLDATTGLVLLLLPCPQVPPVAVLCVELELN